MLKLLLNLIKSPKSLFPARFGPSRFYIKKIVAMAGESVKNKSDPNLEQLTIKKKKLNSDEYDEVQSRTVATMCGAWRPDEVDGGLIFVFKTREACLSPDPTKECDYPENIEDFWEASLVSSGDIQVSSYTFSSLCTEYLWTTTHLFKYILDVNNPYLHTL